MIRLVQTVIALGSLVFADVAHAQSEYGPDVLMRSLLQVQDDIAAGDDSALPMQRHLMDLLDASIGEAGQENGLRPEEVRAVLIAGVIAAQSTATNDALSELGKDGTYSELANALVDYRLKRRRQTIDRFAKIKLDSLDARVAPYVIFANGNLLVRSSPKMAIKLYDKVRLLAPGTLLEETAMRRLLVLHYRSRDGERFIKIAKQYARRFLKSPYRQQYLTLVGRGVMSLRRGISHTHIGELADLMPQRSATSFLLHLTRRSVISGHLKLAKFSIERVILLSKQNKMKLSNGPQLELFNVLADLTSDEPAMLKKRLKKIDGESLQKEDRQLLIAAKKIVVTMIEPLSENAGVVAEAAPVEGEETADQMVANDKAASSTPSKLATMTKEESDGVDGMDEFIKSVRDNLREIDNVLSE